MREYLPILGIPSIALLFLPYTFGVSPRATVSSGRWNGGGLPLALLGGPFFLSIPILMAQTRVLLKRHFSKGERATYWLLACAALALGLAFLGRSFNAQAFRKEPIESSLIFIPYAAAVWLTIRSARKLNPEEATMVMLRVTWLPNAIFCAIGFWDGWEIGASLAAFTIVLYTVGIAVSMGTNRRAGISS
jgi:hypothetical protein